VLKIAVLFIGRATRGETIWSLTGRIAAVKLAP